MAILNIKLDLDDSYVRLIKDVYKWLIIIIFVHLLLCITYGEKGSINLVGEFLHSDFITLMIYIVLGFAFYYLVMERLVELD